MKDRDFIRLTLRVYKSEAINEEIAVENIVNTCKNGKISNWFSFNMGWIAGIGLYSLVKYFFS